MTEIGQLSLNYAHALAIPSRAHGHPLAVAALPFVTPALSSYRPQISPHLANALRQGNSQNPALTTHIASFTSRFLSTWPRNRQINDHTLGRFGSCLACTDWHIIFSPLRIRYATVRRATKDYRVSSSLRLFAEPVL